MTRQLFTFCFICLMLLPLRATAKESFTVIIDAGHGGGDVGTPHRKCRLDEKTIALNVALKLGQLIKDNHQDVKVVYTRTSDVYPSLPDRTAIARKAKGNLFISIHVNAAENPSARGFETYVFGITGLAGKSASEQARIKQRTMIERENLDINGKQIDFEKTVDLETKILCQTQREKHNKYSKEFADLVQTSMINALKRSTYRGNVNDRGVKEKNIYVLCYSPMPAILVEMGYMSNVTEERFLNTLEAQNLFATSLYDAFADYKQTWEKRQLDYEGDESSNTLANDNTKQETTLQDVKLTKKSEEEKAEAKAKAEAEAKAKAEAEAKAAAEKAAAEKAAEEARIAKEIAEKQAAEAKAKAEAEAKAKADAEAKAEAKAKADAEAKVKAEAEAKAAAEKAAAEKAAEEARIAKEIAEKQAAEAKAKAEAEAKAKAEAEAKAKAEAEAKAKAEAEARAAATAPVADPTKPYYRIQFLVSAKKLEKGDPRLKGIWPVEYYEDNGSFKYTVGNSTDRASLQAKYKEIKAVFPDAFWVKFDANGHRMK